MIRKRPHPKTRRQAFRVAVWGVVGLLALPACERLKEPELDLDTLYGYTAAPLAVMLSAVQVNGRVNYPVLQRDYADYLDKFLALAAELGPRTDPSYFFAGHWLDAEHRAAYYINVHNGLILLTWLKHGAGSGDTNLRFDPAWLDERIHRVDGRTVSIRDVAELAMQEEFTLVPLALITGTVTGPPVPSPPLEAKTFAQSLDRHVRIFLSDPNAFERLREGDADVFYAPPALGEYAARLGALEPMLDGFVAENHPFKLELLRAARDGRLRFRPHSDRIHLPAATLDPIR